MIVKLTIEKLSLEYNSDTPIGADEVLRMVLGGQAKAIESDPNKAARLELLRRILGSADPARPLPAEPVPAPAAAAAATPAIATMTSEEAEAQRQSFATANAAIDRDQGEDPTPVRKTRKAKPEASPEAPSAPEVTKAAKVERKARLLMCLEKPGKLFTLEQASELAGIKPHSIGVAISPSGLKRYKGKCGDYHFRWADKPVDASADQLQLANSVRKESPAAIAESGALPQPSHDIGEARPRRRGEVMAINPNRISAADTTPTLA